MDTPFKPMLAGEADLTALRFPLVASAKLDGVRAIVRDGIVYSRSNKPIPNPFVQQVLRHLEHCDGELIVGPATSKTAYRDTVSAVMSHGREGYDLRFYVFDHVQTPTRPWIDRVSEAKADGCAALHPQHVVNTLDELLALESDMLAAGYEGLILRDPYGAYKFGRSTTKEGLLLKLKRFTDAEFVVVGFEERMHNGNEAMTNELGRTKRSSHAENKSGRGDLGALILQHPGGFTFNCGTGFDDAERAKIWSVPADYLGRKAKIKFFAIGMKDAPRHPVFLGWRDPSDT